MTNEVPPNLGDGDPSSQLASREDELLWGDAALSPTAGRSNRWGRSASSSRPLFFAGQGSHSVIPDWLFVFEMANNHMGDVEHGIKLVREFARLAEEFPEFTFAFKMQYRNLETFIHPDFRGRKDVKYIRRFEETGLSRGDFRRLVDVVRESNFIPVCTPFDEISVDHVLADGFEILKIASCSLTDWPLLERAVKAPLPMIVSTAGSSVEEIDNVVAFLKHRGKDFILMHCVAEYPTPVKGLQLNQIDLLRNRYSDVRVGYSTHEQPFETLPVAIAIAKGCCVFEKHVGLATSDYELNGYSAGPEEVRSWLSEARRARQACGAVGARVMATNEEQSNLSGLRRGVFAVREIKPGEKITDKDVFMAMPGEPGQVTANDWSKYISFRATASIAKNAPVLESNTKREDVRGKVWAIVQDVKSLLMRGNVVIPGQSDLEISHHYGLDRFAEYGICMITVVNREYCKKLIVILPGQRHPEQFHKFKEETFHILYGDLDLTLDGRSSHYAPGDVITIERTTRHAFTSKTGAILEEISSTHYQDDSFYTDPSIALNKDRKTFVTYWM